MKKLFCKIGVVASLSVMLLFFFALAYGTMPAFVALCGTAFGFLSMWICWESFIRLETAGRRRPRRTRVPLSHTAPVQPIHAA